MNYYNNAVVYITGGSSGIGYAIAEEVLSKGARVVLFARDKKKLTAAQRALSHNETERAERIGIFPLDVSDPKNTMKTIPLAVKKFGVPSILINCAGIAASVPFESSGYELFKSMLEINVLGTRNMNYSVIPFMKQNGGTIVNVASLAGLIGVYGYSAYGASKFAIIGMSETMRLEFKSQGIRVKVVCPPEVDTPMVREESKTILPVAKRLKVLAGVMTAEEAARYIVRKIPGSSFLIIPGVMARISYSLTRHFPRFSRWTVDMMLDFFEKRGL